jgi:hypothetical protein
VDRREAEAIYDAGREVVVEVLLRMDRQIQQLTARVDRLERELAKDSRKLVAAAVQRSGCEEAGFSVGAAQGPIGQAPGRSAW